MSFARVVLTVILLCGSAASFFLDWSSNHLLNPLWHPHARFHGGLLLFFLAGVSVIGTWLLWRKSTEPQVAVTVAALIALSFWTPLFYAGLLVPGSSPWAGLPSQEPHIAGFLFYPNLGVAFAVVVLTIGAWFAGYRANTNSRQGMG